MTEQVWLISEEPLPMLALLRGKVSNRKLRLFAAGCCRSIWDVLAAGGREQIETAEKYADDLVPVDALYDGEWYTGDETGDLLASLEGSYMWDALATVGLDDTIGDYFSSISNIAKARALPKERQRQCHLLRCIFGNPFRPLTIKPSLLTDSVLNLAAAIYGDRAWDRLPVLADALEESGVLDSAVLRLAAAIYEERAFERMPVLADALEESGVTDSALLGHLRGPGPHARGCHVLDLVLGKE